MTEMIPRTTVSEVIGYRDASIAKMDEAIEALSRGFGLAEDARNLGTSAHRGQVFTANHRAEGPIFDRVFDTFDGDKLREMWRSQIDARVWVHLVKLTGMESMMDKKARAEFYEGLAKDVPPVTEDNIYATMERLVRDARLIFRRGLANAFSSLDRRFKSHDGFKIGSRVILTRVFDAWGCWEYRSKMADTIADIERCFLVLDGKPAHEVGTLEQAIKADRAGKLERRQSVTESDYFKVRCFKNGNAHLYFQRPDLVEKVNLELAAYYGEVLPDAVRQSESVSRTTALAKNLSFYATPNKVVEKMLNLVRFEITSLLEPSAGEGGIIVAASKAGRLGRVERLVAYEVHEGRLDALRRNVNTTRLGDVTELRHQNFLRDEPVAAFSHVLMNPPFYGTHWMQHVMSAYEHLVEGGELVAVLPVSAHLGETKKHKAFRQWCLRSGCRKNYNSDEVTFYDLPAGSFSESGTNINTVLLHLTKI